MIFKYSGENIDRRKKGKSFFMLYKELTVNE